DAIDVGAESVPAFADIDGDGDQDLLVGTKIEPDNPRTGGLYWFENTGTARAPALQLRGHLSVRPAFHLAPALGDLDGDGRPDLVLGQFQDAVSWYRNSGASGAGRFVLVDSAAARLPRGSNAVPELHDSDGDGDLDLFVGDAGGRVAFFRNDGTKQSPRFALADEDYLDARLGRRVVPRFLNGRLILGTERGGIDSTLGVSLPHYAAPAFARLRGDALDLIIGGAGGGLQYFEGRSTSK
ncbi:MAG TPA: VCBS repeat-containing protein, partial [Gemmatimonadales bacterium]|nr:VCBS repeat-containing protein [Gemmatimonadales bacterium]